MVFDSLYTQLLQGGLDASWRAMQTHTDNIANYSTPNFKAKRVEFKEVFSRVSEAGRGRVVLRTALQTDEDTAARLDGNNVSMEYEQLELWKAQAQYAALTAQLNAEYGNLRTVISTLKA